VYWSCSIWAALLLTMIVLAAVRWPPDWFKICMMIVAAWGTFEGVRDIRASRRR
jgi:hypothetical protein